MERALTAFGTCGRCEHLKTVPPVRYADDTVVGFELRSDAERFVDELRQRLQKFVLELHPHKTRIIEFGRFAARPRR